ncbi:MAG: nucleotidyltransferase family protein [Pseudomonadota bacterium]
MPDAVMIFAAGFGTRMGQLTKDRPKPLIEVAGKALLDHALDHADDAAVPTCVVNAHYRADQVVRHVASRPSVTVSHESPDLLDTGGGLKNALPALGEGPVFTLNSDAVWNGPNPLRTLADAWKPDHMDALLLTVPRARVWGREGGGDFMVDAEGRLHRGGALVYTGAQILKTDLVAKWPETAFSLNAIWDDIAHAGRLFGEEYPGHWADVGHPAGIVTAETMLRASAL